MTYGWLIEQQLNGRAVWWCAPKTCGRTWTTDASEAIRFARQQDAENVLRKCGLILEPFWRDAIVILEPFWSDAIVTDHSWG